MNSYEARLSKAAAWSCVGYIVIFVIGWGILGRNIPPYPASLSADEIARIYREHSTAFRIGFASTTAGCALYASWSVGLFRVLRAIDPSRSLIPAYLQLIGGALTVVPPMLADVIWLTAAFRPETDPAITRTLVDLGWMVFDITWSVTLLQYVGFLLAVFLDRRSKPLYPRWLGWLGVWFGCEFVLMIIMPFFRSGPFGWGGIFNYWIPYLGPFVWMILVVVYTLKATDRLAAEYSEQHGPMPQTSDAALM